MTDNILKSKATPWIVVVFLVLALTGGLTAVWGGSDGGDAPDIQATVASALTVAAGVSQALELEPTAEPSPTAVHPSPVVVTVEIEVEVTREVDVPVEVEVTRISEIEVPVEVEVTRQVEVTVPVDVEVTREVEVTRQVVATATETPTALPATRSREENSVDFIACLQSVAPGEPTPVACDGVNATATAYASVFTSTPTPNVEGHRATKVAEIATIDAILATLTPAPTDTPTPMPEPTPVEVSLTPDGS